MKDKFLLIIGLLVILAAIAIPPATCEKWGMAILRWIETLGQNGGAMIIIIPTTGAAAEAILEAYLESREK